MDDGRNFVAVGLLTRNDLDLLGNGFRTAFPIEDCPSFDDILARIDAAEESSKMNGSQPAD